MNAGLCDDAASPGVSYEHGWSILFVQGAGQLTDEGTCCVFYRTKGLPAILEKGLCVYQVKDGKIISGQFFM